MNLTSSLEPMQTRATCLLPAKRPSSQFIRFGFVSNQLSFFPANSDRQIAAILGVRALVRLDGCGR